MARGHGGSHTDVDVPSTRPRGGEGDGDGPSRRRPSSGPAGSVDAGHGSVEAAFQAGRVGSGSAASTPARTPVTSRVTGEQLPDGYFYDAGGKLQGPGGGFASDPTAPPREHSRATEYPHDFRQSTYDHMTTNYTEEGIAAGGVPRDPTTGERIPRDQLTWIDKYGNPLPHDDFSLEHEYSVAEHWEVEGHDMDRPGRADWYNDTSNLGPMSRRQNSSEGAQSEFGFDQLPGDNYSN